jgi:hypothetical protein
MITKIFFNKKIKIETKAFYNGNLKTFGQCPGKKVIFSKCKNCLKIKIKDCVVAFVHPFSTVPNKNH